MYHLTECRLRLKPKDLVDSEPELPVLLLKLPILPDLSSSSILKGTCLDKAVVRAINAFFLLKLNEVGIKIKMSINFYRFKTALASAHSLLIFWRSAEVELVLNSPRDRRLSPSWRQLSTELHTALTLLDSSWTVFLVTLSSIRCFTHFLRLRTSRSFSSCSWLRPFTISSFMRRGFTSEKKICCIVC